MVSGSQVAAQAPFFISASFFEGTLPRVKVWLTKTMKSLQRFIAPIVVVGATLAVFIASVARL